MLDLVAISGALDVALLAQLAEDQVEPIAEIEGAAMEKSAQMVGLDDPVRSERSQLFQEDSRRPAQSGEGSSWRCYHRQGLYAVSVKKQRSFGEFSVNTANLYDSRLGRWVFHASNKMDGGGHFRNHRILRESFRFQRSAPEIKTIDQEYPSHPAEPGVFFRVAKIRRAGREGTGHVWSPWSVNATGGCNIPSFSGVVHRCRGR